MSYWLSLMLITSFASRLGEQSLAVMTYTQSVQRLVILFSISLGLGTEILIGRMIGAGQFDAAYREVIKSVRIGLLISTSAILLVALAAPHLIRLFSTDSAIISGGVLLLHLAIFYEPARVFNIVIINALRATGDARFAIKIGVITQWGLSVPLCWYCGVRLHGGLPAIWVVMLAEEWLRGLIVRRRWMQRRWMKYAQRSRDKIQNATELQLIHAQPDSISG
jgi:Na+-driven multidrug efflux pump